MRASDLGPNLVPRVLSLTPGSKREEPGNEVASDRLHCHARVSAFIFTIGAPRTTVRIANKNVNMASLTGLRHVNSKQRDEKDR